MSEDKQTFQINFNDSSFIDLAKYYIEREFDVQVKDIEYFCYGDYGQVVEGEKHWAEEVRVTVEKSKKEEQDRRVVDKDVKQRLD